MTTASNILYRTMRLGGEPLHRDDDILEQPVLRALLMQGFAPQFDSLAKICNQACELGASRAYREYARDHDSLGQLNRCFAKSQDAGRLTDADLNLIIDMAVTGIGQALQLAARIGYDRTNS